MKNHPVLFPIFRLILVSVILLMLGTSFSSPVIKAALREQQETK